MPQPLFYTTTSVKRDKIFHHFLDKFYRFNRRKVRPKGRAYFHCSVRACSARLCADYSSGANIAEEEPVLDLATLTPHHLHLLPDGSPHPIQVCLLPACLSCWLENEIKFCLCRWA